MVTKLMTRNLLVLAGIIIFSLPVLGQHWETPEPTGFDHSIVIQQAICDGLSLVDGDEIAVFTPGGILAGHLIWLGEGVQGMPAWGDDPTTTDVTEGFTANEAMNFKYWISDRQLEINAEVEIVSGPELFVVDGFTTLNLVASSNSIGSETQILPELQFKAWPVPFNSHVTFEVEKAGKGGSLFIYTSNGRLVKTLNNVSGRFDWDGRDNFGQMATSGVYYCEYKNAIGKKTLKIIKLD